MNRWYRLYAFSPALIAIFATMSVFALPTMGAPQSGTDRLVRIEGAILKVIDSAQVPAELQGVLANLGFREGQQVQKGDLIAKIKSADLAVELKRANARHEIASTKRDNKIDIQFARKSAEVSSARLNRSLNSNHRAPGVVSRGKIQELELEAHRDNLRVEQATKNIKVAGMETKLTEADVELARNKIEKTNIFSPLTGVVVMVDKKPGEWVEPGETVVKVVRLDRLRLEGFVPASQAGRISIGDSSKVLFEQDWLSNQKLEGKVVFVNPEANPVNSQVEVWVEIDNPDQKLLPGLEATIEIDCASTAP